MNQYTVVTTMVDGQFDLMQDGKLHCRLAFWRGDEDSDQFATRCRAEAEHMAALLNAAATVEA